MGDYHEFLDSIDRKAYHEGEWQWEEDGYTVTRTYNYSAPGCHDSCGVLLYTKDGQHYLMEFDIHGGQGHGSGDYRLFTLENGGEHTVRENHVEFDYCWTGAGADVRENFDPEAVDAFVEEADSLLSRDPDLKTCPAIAERAEALFRQAADTLN